MRCVALDDEQNALDVITMYCDKVEGLELLAAFTDPIKASQFLAGNKVDLLFLDINMPGLSGFDLLETLPTQPLIIFTTAYSEYAVKSYSVDALDYLLKPIPFGRFVKAVNKAEKQLKGPEEKVVSAPKEETRMINIKSGSVVHRLNPQQVRYVQADGNYVKFVTDEGKVMTLMSMKEVAETLGEGFLQIHRSYLVSLDRIAAIENHQLQIGGEWLPVGVSYRKQVRERLKAFLG